MYDCRPHLVRIQVYCGSHSVWPSMHCRPLPCCTLGDSDSFVAFTFCICLRAACLQLWTWGEGGCGQLGFPKVSSLASPTIVAPAVGSLVIYHACVAFKVTCCCLQAPNDAGRWVDVACGWAHCVGLTHTRRVFTWGLNCKGQLGLGDMKARSKPCQVCTFEASRALSATHLLL